MMFSIPLMCCEYRDVELLTRVHTSQRATALCDSTLTGSKDYFLIQPSALELSVNSNMCEPCPSCRMVMYIDIADDRNYNSFSVIFPCHSDGIFYRHAKSFLLYPSMPYLQVSDHIFTYGLKKTMLLIGTPLEVTCWRNLIHGWISW